MSSSIRAVDSQLSKINDPLLDHLLGDNTGGFEHVDHITRVGTSADVEDWFHTFGVEVHFQVAKY